VPAALHALGGRHEVSNGVAQINQEPYIIGWVSRVHIMMFFIMYEGWNFNSGNYLFTTDTKYIYVSKFYCPSL